MKLTLEYVEKDYNNLKKIAKKELDRKNYEDCLNLISCAANIAYHLNSKFYDDEFENYLEILSFNLIENINFENISGRWIFYDYFGLDNRGLTQQYLNALDDLGIEYLYILERYISEKEHKDIIEQVKNNEKATMYINDSSLNFKVQIKNILRVISEYKPEKALLQFAPWSCLSIILWARLNLIERYFINLTDHAFWLGKSSFDYCLEFREYGFQLSKDYRKIPFEKLLIQKYYPIVGKNKFLGFPKEVNDKKIIFTGGAYYKILGYNNLFLDILKKILEQNPDSIILFAGGGNSKVIDEYIIKNKLEDRFLLIGHRSDINEVIKNSYLYLNTFPVGGGLLSLYAILNKTIVLSFGTKSLRLINPETLFLDGIDYKITYYDESELLQEINKVLNDNNYKKYKESQLENLIITPEKFKENFENIINSENINYNFSISISNDEISELRKLYLDVENNYLKQYDLIKFKWLGLNYFKYDFFSAFISAIRILINNKELIWIKIKKRLGIH